MTLTELHKTCNTVCNTVGVLYKFLNGSVAHNGGYTHSVTAAVVLQH